MGGGLVTKPEKKRAGASEIALMLQTIPLMVQLIEYINKINESFNYLSGLVGKYTLAHVAPASQALQNPEKNNIVDFFDSLSRDLPKIDFTNTELLNFLYGKEVEDNKQGNYHTLGIEDGKVVLMEISPESIHNRNYSDRIKDMMKIHREKFIMNFAGNNQTIYTHLWDNILMFSTLFLYALGLTQLPAHTTLKLDGADDDLHHHVQLGTRVARSFIADKSTSTLGYWLEAQLSLNADILGKVYINSPGGPTQVIFGTEYAKRDKMYISQLLHDKELQTAAAAAAAAAAAPA